MLDPDDTHQRGIVLLVALSVVVVTGLALWTLPDGGGGTDVAGATTVDSCTTLTEPGAYVLTADVTDSETGTCIRIHSDDVVLDGAGHTIDGVGAFGSAGVVVEPRGDGSLTNVTVRNVTVTDWDDGVRYVRVLDGSVAGTTTANNRVGLTLLNARNNTLADNVARSNRLRGIALFEESANNTLSNNTVRANGFGISLVEPGTRNNTLVGNTASSNEFGIVLVDAHDNALLDNAANENRIAGIWLTAARNNTLARNGVSNRFYGIFLSDRSNDNRLTDNTATGNAVGIRLRSSDGSLIARNTVRASSDTAILLISSNDNELVGNTGVDNARGISVVRSSGNVIANNSVGA